MGTLHSKSLLHFPAVGLLCLLVCVSTRTVVSTARNPQRQSGEGCLAIPMIASFSVYQGVEKLATRHRSSRNGSTHCAVLGLTSSANSGAKQGAVNHLLRNPQPHLPRRLGYSESSCRAQGPGRVPAKRSWPCHFSPSQDPRPTLHPAVCFPNRKDERRLQGFHFLSPDCSASSPSR